MPGEEVHKKNLPGGNNAQPQCNAWLLAPIDLGQVRRCGAITRRYRRTRRPGTAAGCTSAGAGRPPSARDRQRVTAERVAADPAGRLTERHMATDVIGQAGHILSKPAIAQAQCSRQKFCAGFSALDLWVSRASAVAFFNLAWVNAVQIGLPTRAGSRTR